MSSGELKSLTTVKMTICMLDNVHLRSVPSASMRLNVKKERVVVKKATSSSLMPSYFLF